MLTDAQGLPVTGSAASVAALDRVIYDFYAWTGDILGDLGRATAQDPRFALGHAATATILMLGGFRGDHPAVTAEIAAAKAIGVTPREQDHVAIAELLARSRMRAAAQRCEAILAEHPRDALALRYATDLYYYLGESSAIRDVVARALPRWREDDPIFGFVLGRHAFGLEESGELDQADMEGRRALAINPEDAWATHAMAHVHETSGRAEEGLRVLEETRAHWSVGKWLAVHNGWHLALFLIELGRGEEVLAGYDRFIQPRLKDNFILDLIDAAALLWRLELDGVDVADRWREVARVAAARIGEHVLAFNDLHVALGLAGAKEAAAMARLIESTDRYLATETGDNRATTAAVGRALVAGTVAFGAGDWRRAIDDLASVRGDVWRIGGSHAQREIVEQTLIAAAIRATDWTLARSLLVERTARHPRPRDFGIYARAAALAKNALGMRKN